MPVSDCSMTCVTLFCSVSADAPGKFARTETCGGAMSGYCAIGSAHDRADAAHHHDDREHPGEDRPVDEDA